MRLKMFGALGVILLAAACSSADQPDTTATGRAAPGSVAEFQQVVGDRVFFDLDSSQLRPDGRDTLNKQAGWLRQYTNYAITVEGHADERGTREYNLALGARRAQTVQSYLAAQGVPPTRMKTISYGKERPEVVGSDEGAWSRNRRGVTALQ
ncbi:MAG: peptidoglycan-associated lipoprotein Pal [Alphaproteobacteria bacterium]|nr:peptidoglycan-associated lipoprotein Pal [Alphaproteobacteria bacterium]MCW5743200.1 peptidoglycan-associated lipoprotein Pal [Alphaproteobacteria bacterium]